MNAVPSQSSPFVLYRFYDSAGRLLYIGRTEDPRSRFKAHEGKSWWPDVTDRTMQNCADLDELVAAERAAIIAERPLHNIAFNGQGGLHTYSLAEVSAILQLTVKDPERWLRRRLNSGELRGVRLGRDWRMRRQDVEFMMRLYANDHLVDAADRPEPEPAVEPTPVVDIMAGLSARSRKRLRRIAD